jgi:hypothetical protein
MSVLTFFAPQQNQPANTPVMAGGFASVPNNSAPKPASSNQQATHVAVVFALIVLATLLVRW